MTDILDIDFDTLYRWSRLLSSWAWLIYALCYLILVIAMGRIAWKKMGPPFKWPLPGRWILTFHYASICLVFAELTLVFLFPFFIDGFHIGDRGIMILSFLTLLPLVFLPWLIKRILSSGLTDGIK
jgi:hypothetical protein